MQGPEAQAQNCTLSGRRQTQRSGAGWHQAQGGMVGRGETPPPQDLTSSPHNDLWAPHTSPIQGQTSLRRCVGSKPQRWRKDYWLGWGRDKVMF